jgi:hypothetical protein
MRDSINYNLKYFIMKTSGTKPMKNTMRKPSPLKFITASTVMGAASKVGAAVGKKAKSATDAATTKPVEGKPSSKPTTSRGAFAGAASKAAEIASKAKAQANKSETTKTGTAAPKKGGSLRDVARTLKARSEAKKATATTKAPEGKPKIAVKKAAPTMQLKKAGMKKKC